MRKVTIFHSNGTVTRFNAKNPIAAFHSIVKKADRTEPVIALIEGRDWKVSVAAAFYNEFWHDDYFVALER